MRRPILTFDNLVVTITVLFSPLSGLLSPLVIIISMQYNLGPGLEVTHVLIFAHAKILYGHVVLDDSWRALLHHLGL